MEYKSIPLEVKDLDIKKGEAIIAHSVFDSIDLVDDIARTGMFTKSWNETKGLHKDGSVLYDIDVLLNHDENKAWAAAIGVLDDGKKGYTHVKAGEHTDGKDVILMLDSGIARKASFGFVAQKAKRLTLEKKSVRELKEVMHLETSVLTKLAAHPKAGVIAVRKSFQGLQMDIKSLTDSEQRFLINMLGNRQIDLQSLVNFSGALDVASDLYTYTQYWISRMNDMIGDMKSQLKYNTKSLPVDSETKAAIDRMRKFIKNSTASDETLQEIEADLKSFEGQLNAINTADTPIDITEPSVSAGNESETKDLGDELLLLTLKF